ncbi:MAG: DinB family protein [Blastocatellia bacterium]
MSKTLSERPAPTEHAPYYGKYIDLVPDGDIVATLGRQLDDALALFGSISESQADSRYAPGKWSIKELIGHIMDAERIFGYRALRFARNDQTPLPGFEQDDYVKYGGFGEQRLSDLVSEYEHVRRANIHLFRGLSDEAWGRRGTSSGNELSVRALAYIIAGHELHHMGIIRTKYL